METTTCRFCSRKNSASVSKRSSSSICLCIRLLSRSCPVARDRHMRAVRRTSFQVSSSWELSCLFREASVKRRHRERTAAWRALPRASSKDFSRCTATSRSTARVISVSWLCEASAVSFWMRSALTCASRRSRSSTSSSEASDASASARATLRSSSLRSSSALRVTSSKAPRESPSSAFSALASFFADSSRASKSARSAWAAWSASSLASRRCSSPSSFALSAAAPSGPDSRLRIRCCRALFSSTTS
mmetsp:Transcript_9567/g.25985  ORF Transcript_9567/g.25985 Transcript_9567/m.25985 type:complete len:247 (+) Transcript_9567:610-1350(+)